MARRMQAIVALDLGSTFCGYAYYIDNPNSHNAIKNKDIKLNKPWRPIGGHDHLKTPTALLYDDDGRLKAFGFDAIEKASGQQGRNFYRYFKKSAKDTQVFGFTTPFKNQSDSEKCRLDLYADIMATLKAHCLEFIKTSEDECPQTHEIFWVLCVPMVWAIQEKEFMIAAAFQAGLITELKSTNIAVILEGDAAYCFCRELETLDEFKTRLSLDDIENIRKSSGVLVADIGGQTVDVTTKVSEASSKHDFVSFEVRHPSGKNAGGEEVNTKFVEKLSQIVGDRVIKTMKEEHLESWLIMMNDFEVQKKNRSRDTEYIVLKDIATLEKVYREENGGSELFELLDVDSDKMYIDEGRRWLKIKSEFMNRISEETIEKITKHILDKLNEENIAVVFLTGGYASCPFLEDHIRKEVQGRAHVVIPRDPEQSVLKGAVLYSRSCRNLSIQHVDANYGVTTTSFHDSQEKEMHPHILEKGKQVLKGRVYENIISRDDLQNKMELPIYRGKTDDFMEFTLNHVDDPNVDAKLKIQLQICETDTSEPMPFLQATVTDEITRDTFIRRKRIAQGALTFKKFASIVVIILLLAVAFELVYWSGGHYAPVLFHFCTRQSIPNTWFQ